MKRLISANTSEMLAMNAEELKQSIKVRGVLFFLRMWLQEKLT